MLEPHDYEALGGASVWLQSSEGAVARIEAHTNGCSVGWTTTVPVARIVAHAASAFGSDATEWSSTLDPRPRSLNGQASSFEKHKPEPLEAFLGQTAIERKLASVSMSFDDTQVAWLTRRIDGHIQHDVFVTGSFFMPEQVFALFAATAEPSLATDGNRNVVEEQARRLLGRYAVA